MDVQKTAKIFAEELDVEIKKYLDEAGKIEPEKVCEFLSKAYAKPVTWNGIEFWSSGGVAKLRSGKIWDMKPASPYVYILVSKFMIQWDEEITNLYNKGEQNE